MPEARRIGPHIEGTVGKSGFFGYGFCSPHPQDSAMWWSTQPCQGLDAAAYRAMDQEAIRRHLLDFHARWHEPIPSILNAAENIVVTETLDVATLPVWSRGRTLLIGDAAHVTSPHAGQGASLALEDAMRLGCLMRAGRELGQIFQAFGRNAARVSNASSRSHAATATASANSVRPAPGSATGCSRC